MIYAGFWGYDIWITEHMWTQARIWSEQIMATGLNNRRSYTGIEDPERYVVGYVGEQGFCSFLDQFGKRYEWKPKLDGKSDQSGRDHKVWTHSGRCISINVKTASQARHRFMFVPKAQLDLWRCDLYVACQILGHNWLGVHGYIRHSRMTKYTPKMVKAMTVKCPLKDLSHIDKLLAAIQ